MEWCHCEASSFRKWGSGYKADTGPVIPTWNELTLQLHREYFKAHDSCQDSVELMRQTQKQGLFQLQAAPDDDKRLLSVLITNHAKKV
ncbi:unnamed protein product [Rotaria socialis]|uniref:Uncharacterized protein n=1 Tax=Rotaria socialis TaxID=392032 RepID=A0A818MSG9_9BILA|nr:unnamed protein product [Rotaria socialis]CAF4334510.1 unnamed protein product [Rotaria socialis]CAF4469035.1 unnamed protein product [Rotaria socialis]